MKEHIPKRHLDFENPITGKQFDNTYDRINGVTRPEAMITENHEYGTAKNAADYLPMVGRKTQNFEREVSIHTILFIRPVSAHHFSKLILQRFQKLIVGVNMVVWPKLIFWQLLINVLLLFSTNYRSKG